MGSLEDMKHLDEEVQKLNQQADTLEQQMQERIQRESDDLADEIRQEMQPQIDFLRKEANLVKTGLEAMQRAA